MPSYSIAIVGQGIAGAAAALFLARSGHQVRQFERARSDADAGAGIVLHPIGLAVLRAAHLEAAIWAVGERIDHTVATFAASGQTVRLDYAEFDPHVVACGIHRSALLNILQTNAHELANVTTHWAQPIVSADHVTGCITDADGNQHGPFDLIIGADGAASALRQQIREWVRHDSPYNDAAVVRMLDCDDAHFRGGVHQRFTRGDHVSTWPVGCVRPGEPRRITVAMRVSAAEAWPMAGNVDAWRARLRLLHPALAERLNGQQQAHPLLAYTYRDVAMRRTYSGRLLLIGDAAHAMSPQLGLGASLALSDAWALNTCLTGSQSIEAALALFDAERRAAIAGFQDLSRRVTPMFQSTHPVISAVRERAAISFGRSPMLKRTALKALCEVPSNLS
jgi:2-polyprenyl-6-methoxyphenol hydroxylase-like FAD-dependent oxidoreductase